MLFRQVKKPLCDVFSSLCSWSWGRGGHISVYKLTTVTSPSSLATNMDTESFLDGATLLSNSVQTALMNVSHFILGIHFCAANGHNYVAKLRGALNKTELSTKACRKRWAESLAIAGLWKKGCQESQGKQRRDGERPSWALWAGSARGSWGNSSCHPCRNVMGHLQGLQLHVHPQPMGFPLPLLHKFC